MKSHPLFYRVTLVLAVLLLLLCGALLWWHLPAHLDQIDPNAVYSSAYRSTDHPEYTSQPYDRAQTVDFAEAFRSATLTRYLPSAYKQNLNTFTICFWDETGELLYRFEVYPVHSSYQLPSDNPSDSHKRSWILVRDGTLWEVHPSELIERFFGYL